MGCPMVDSTDAAATLEATRALRRSTVALLRSVTSDRASIVVPSCPAWTVQQLACHLVGVVEDVTSGNLAGASSDPWTAAQVARHVGDSCADLAAIWEELGGTFDASVEAAPQSVRLLLLMDMTTHSHDLRHALGDPGGRDEATAAFGAAYLLNQFERFDAAAAAAVDALDLTPFERFRVVTGRRSRAQLAALGVPVEAFESFLATTPISLAPRDVLDE